MSSPSSSSSGIAGSRRSRRPSRSSLVRTVAAALVAAATVWTPVPFLQVAGPLAVGVWAVAALGLYLAVTPGVWPIFAGEALNVAALFVGATGLLIAGCSALRRPSRAWWGVPLSTLVAAGVTIGLASALTANTGLCPD